MWTRSSVASRSSTRTRCSRSKSLPISPLKTLGLALTASLAFAGPAFASGGIWCEGDGVSVEIATGRLPVLHIIGAHAQAGGKAFTSGPERGEGEPFVVGQAFAGDDSIMVDFVDPNFESILVSLRLLWEVDREQEWPLNGTMMLGGNSYPVRCGAD